MIRLVVVRYSHNVNGVGYVFAYTYDMHGDKQTMRVHRDYALNPTDQQTKVAHELATKAFGECVPISDRMPVKQTKAGYWEQSAIAYRITD